MAKFFKLNFQESCYLLIVSFVYCLTIFFYIFKYPISIDEALTFEWFTSKGAFTSLTTYPEPNNHVLFSLISNVFESLPITPILKLRLPNVLLGLLLVVIVYLFLKKEFSHKISVLPHTIFVFSYAITCYSVLARGYMLVIFSSTMCFIFLLYYLRYNNFKYFKYFILFSIIGFWSIPLFLYPFLSFIVVLFVNFKKIKIKDYKALFIGFLLISFSVCLFYFPIIYYNGLKSLIGNSAIQNRSLNDLNHYFDLFFRAYDNLIGINSFIIMLSFVVVLLVSIVVNSRDRHEKSFVLILISIPYFFSFLQNIWLSPRMLVYLIFPFIFGISLLLGYFKIFSKIPLFFIYIFAILIFTIEMRIFNKTHKESFLSGDLVGEQIWRYIDINNKKNPRIFIDAVDEPYDYFILSYYLNCNSSNFKIDTSFLNFKKNNTNLYDYMLIKEKRVKELEFLNTFNSDNQIYDYLIYKRE